MIAAYLVADFSNFHGFRETLPAVDEAIDGVEVASVDDEGCTCETADIVECGRKKMEEREFDMKLNGQISARGDKVD